MNKIVFTAFAASSAMLVGSSLAGGPTPFAEPPAPAPAPTSEAGFYVNGAIGYGHVDDNRDYKDEADKGAAKVKGLEFIKDADVTDEVVKSDKDGFAWWVNLGYQFNRHIAAEAGYMGLPNSSADYSILVKPKGGDPKFTADGRIRNKADLITLVAKGILPFSGSQFAAFAKAGVGFTVSRSFNNRILAIDTGTLSVPAMDVETSKDKSHRVVPLFALGFDYDLGENLALEVQGVVTIKSGRNSSSVSTKSSSTSIGMPATYSILAGLSYKFATV